MKNGKTSKVRVSGHLIDSGTLTKICDLIVQHDSKYEVLDFQVGRTNEDTSEATLSIASPTDEVLQDLLEQLLPHGIEALEAHDADLETAPADGVVPDDFYSTSNHVTDLRINGKWVRVGHQRMDAVITVTDGRPVCTKLRNVQAGDSVVVGNNGIRVFPPEKDRDQANFGFMTNEVSSERVVELAVHQLVDDIRRAKKKGEKIVVVAGPVVVHTGGVEPLSRLIADGVVDSILCGNALAVHDIERALYNTSLGIDASTGQGVVDGHRNHMRAINAIRRAGSISKAVEQGVLDKGLMYECVKAKVPFVMAGSLRDDGPLPEVITDMNEAQEAYGEKLENASVILILSTMLHGIAVGNMLPSAALTVCVDINPAVVTKLADRGTSQAIGVVTDVGLFLSLLARELSTVTS